LPGKGKAPAQRKFGGTSAGGANFPFLAREGNARAGKCPRGRASPKSLHERAFWGFPFPGELEGWDLRRERGKGPLNREGERFRGVLKKWGGGGRQFLSPPRGKKGGEEGRGKREKKEGGKSTLNFWGRGGGGLLQRTDLFQLPG